MLHQPKTESVPLVLSRPTQPLFRPRACSCPAACGVVRQVFGLEFSEVEIRRTPEVRERPRGAKKKQTAVVVDFRRSWPGFRSRVLHEEPFGRWQVWRVARPNYGRSTASRRAFEEATCVALSRALPVSKLLYPPHTFFISLFFSCEFTSSRRRACRLKTCQQRFRTRLAPDACLRSGAPTNVAFPHFRGVA